MADFQDWQNAIAGKITNLTETQKRTLRQINGAADDDDLVSRMLTRFPEFDPRYIENDYPNLFSPDFLDQIRNEVNDDGHEREPPYKDTPDHDNPPDFSRT